MQKHAAAAPNVTFCPIDLGTVHISATVGVIVGAANRTGSLLARTLLGGGAASITLLGGRRDQAALTGIGHELTAPDPGRRVRTHALDLDDPVALAQRLASIRHDEGPVDWIVNLIGPGARPDPASGPAEAVLELDLTPPRWPELSLAASTARVQATLGRTVVLTRLAREEFRHRTGVLVHAWLADSPDADPAGPDSLWVACAAAIRTLTSADAAADAAAGMGVALVDDGDGTAIAGVVRGAFAGLGRDGEAGRLEGGARW